jgi:hypothetical protein
MGLIERLRSTGDEEDEMNEFYGEDNERENYFHLEF